MASSNKINIVIKAEDKASKPLRDVSNEMDSGAGKASKFKAALGSLGGVLGKTVLAAGALGLAAGTAGATIGFGFNSSVEQAETKLNAFMKDGERVAKTLAWVKDEAAKTQFSFTDMADAAANLTPVAKSSGQSLEGLVRQAEILAAINPTEGLTGATFSLREALSGDWVSIIDRFNLPRKRINELKEQGVPAMEIISRTLKEMGIDYGLVAEQGKTVSARFDQVKDKLTMMAGAAMKPIFDRVSKDLDNLGSFNYEGLGTRMGGMLSSALEAVDAFIPRVMELGKQVGDYLGPKFEALWGTVNEKLLPALGRLWREVLEPLMPVLGVALVAALGLAIDALRIITDVVSAGIDAFTWLWEQIENGNPIIWGLIGVLGTLGTAMALQAGFAAMTAGFSMMTTKTIPAAITKFGALKALVASPIVMPAIVVGAAIAAVQGVIWILDDMKREAQEAQDYINKSPYTDKNANRWRPSADKSKTMTRGFATGTNYAPGGWAMVGEHGPEPMFVPQGAQVTPSYRPTPTPAAAPSASGPTVVIENYNSYNERDDRRFFRDLGFALEAA